MTGAIGAKGNIALKKAMSDINTYRNVVLFIFFALAGLHAKQYHREKTSHSS